MSCEIVSLSLECHEVAIENHYSGLLLLEGWFPGRMPLEDLPTTGQANMEVLHLFWEMGTYVMLSIIKT